MADRAVRPGGRPEAEMRPIRVVQGFATAPEGSILIEVGRTRVLCNATVDNHLPNWLRDKGRGWVTAEYSLLPRSTSTRVKRERGQLSGRTQEIQRLIGRALRGVCDLAALGERSIILDCDVLEADGGTRTASVVGAFMALVLALRKLGGSGALRGRVIRDWLAAVSVGIVAGTPMLDLEYTEDLAAQVDMNVVMTGSGEFVEIQGTGEEATFSRSSLDKLLGLAERGCRGLIDMQRSQLGDDLP